MQLNRHVRYMKNSDFCKHKRIGSGGYATAYTAKYKHYSVGSRVRETVVLKRFKNFDKTPELFISEVSNNKW